MVASVYATLLLQSPQPRDNSKAQSKATVTMPHSTPMFLLCLQGSPMQAQVSRQGQSSQSLYPLLFACQAVKMTPPRLGCPRASKKLEPAPTSNLHCTTNVIRDSFEVFITNTSHYLVLLLNLYHGYNCKHAYLGVRPIKLIQEWRKEWLRPSSH